MSGIFVSHSYADHAWSRAFVATLRSRGADVWYDEHNMGYGLISRELEVQLQARSVFIVVLSPTSVASPWVRREVDAAINLHDMDPSRVIIPVVAAKCEIPLFWNQFRHVSGEHDTGLKPSEAAERVLAMVAVGELISPLAPAMPIMPENASGDAPGVLPGAGAQSRQLRVAPPVAPSGSTVPTIPRHRTGVIPGTSRVSWLTDRPTSALLLVIVVALVVGLGFVGAPGVVNTLARRLPVASSTSTPGVNRAFKLFALPTADSQPHSIVSGVGDTLWFTEQAGNKIGQLATNGHVIKEYPVLTRASGPLCIVLGPDGAPWFTEQDADKLGTLQADGTIAEYTVPTPAAAPQQLAIGPDNAIWFTERDGNKIGRFGFDGRFTEYVVPTRNAKPGGITTGPDGNVWFTEWAAGKIGRITPSGKITEYPLARSDSAPDDIRSGPDNTIWFTEQGANKLGHISLAGVIHEFLVPSPGAVPSSLVAGPDNELWFTEPSANKLGAISTSGLMTEYLVPTPLGTPSGLAIGPDNNIWFTNFSANQIGVFTPPTT
ncbi:MAG TPA: TIR domain-containing protein [Ktedonobacterales bacterium]